jgi:hypothetical protein
MDALSALPENIRIEAEKVLLDLFPDTTRFPEKWESVFSLYLGSSMQEKQRDIIAAMWRIISGNQGIDFLQEVLSIVESEVTVVENVPVVDPRDKESIDLACCDYVTMVCDNEEACCDYYNGDKSFIPSILQNNTSSIYTIPDERDYWEMCFFVCKNAFRAGNNRFYYIEPIEINIKWKSIIEYLILKIKPLQDTAVLYIKWTED